MNIALISGGAFSFLAALLHIAVIIGGPAWYRMFGAGEEMAMLAEQGSWIPGAITFLISLLFFGWGLYALSGAFIIKRLPFLKSVLVFISSIYLLRGIAIFPVIIFELEPIDALLVWSSLVSFIVGLSYAIGTRQQWSKIPLK